MKKEAKREVKFAFADGFEASFNNHVEPDTKPAERFTHFMRCKGEISATASSWYDARSLTRWLPFLAERVPSRWQYFAALHTRKRRRHSLSRLHACRYSRQAGSQISRSLEKIAFSSSSSLPVSARNPGQPRLGELEGSNNSARRSAPQFRRERLDLQQTYVGIV